MSPRESHKSPDRLVNGSRDASCTVVLAHGAGAGMDSEFMVVLAEGLSQHGMCVVRFEFPYMAERRRTGKRRPPDREPVLRDTWLAVIESVAADRLIIGGKSLGGRMASLIADDVRCAGLVCLGYPFHPAGKPDRLRIEHLKTIQTPTLILQGERDALGNAEEVAAYDLSPQVQIAWLPDGDHSFLPRKSSRRTGAENWRSAIDRAAEFVRHL